MSGQPYRKLSVRYISLSTINISLYGIADDYKQRAILRGLFKVSNSPGYQDVPNIHVALHYISDLAYYGTTRNVSVMIGEQKHKVHKAHATHTNSRETVLQLMKAVNLSQTLRFLLDSTFSDHHLAAQFTRLMTECPILRTKFLGSTTFDAPRTGNVEHERTPFARVRVRQELRSRQIPRDVILQDRDDLVALWEETYEVRLLRGMKLRVQYWSSMTGIINIHDHARTISFPVGAIVALRTTKSLPTRSYNRIQRIITLSVGTLTRCFFTVERLAIVSLSESQPAPYEVFQLSSERLLLTLQDIEPENLHFVRRSPTTWWRNSYVTHFL